jgi:hypothetical protein
MFASRVPPHPGPLPEGEGRGEGKGRTFLRRPYNKLKRSKGVNEISHCWLVYHPASHFLAASCFTVASSSSSFISRA